MQHRPVQSSLQQAPSREKRIKTLSPAQNHVPLRRRPPAEHGTRMRGQRVVNGVCRGFNSTSHRRSKIRSRGCRARVSAINSASCEAPAARSRARGEAERRVRAGGVQRRLSRVLPRPRRQWGGDGSWDRRRVSAMRHAALPGRHVRAQLRRRRGRQARRLRHAILLGNVLRLVLVKSIITQLSRRDS